jgi:hypothetical protein
LLATTIGFLFINSSDFYLYDVSFLTEKSFYSLTALKFDPCQIINLIIEYYFYIKY